jgi:CelD/BcsL family acetyltransferase involved in cellulose biosynthesis
VTIQVELITSPDRFLALAPEWNPLLERSRLGNIFLTWEWMFTWWDWCRSASMQPWVLIARTSQGGHLIGLLPLVLHRWGRLRQLSFMSSDQVIDHLDAVICPGYEDSVVSAFTERLIGKPAPADLLRLEAMAANSLLAQALRERIRPGRAWIRAERCPYLPLPDHWDTYWRMIGANHRSNLRRRARRLEEQADEPIQYYEVRHPAELRDALTALMRLHQERQRHMGHAGAFAKPQVIEFHHQLASRLLERGWLRLYLLRVGERSIAAIYCYRYTDKVYFYQSGYDPAWSHCSPGSLVMAHAIRQAIQENAAEFDFLRGEETYKTLWTPAARTDHLVWISLTLPGWLVIQRYKLGPAVRAKLRWRRTS